MSALSRCVSLTALVGLLSATAFAVTSGEVKGPVRISAEGVTHFDGDMNRFQAAMDAKDKGGALVAGRSEPRLHPLPDLRRLAAVRDLATVHMHEGHVALERAAREIRIETLSLSDESAAAMREGAEVARAAAREGLAAARLAAREGRDAAREAAREGARVAREAARAGRDAAREAMRAARSACIQIVDATDRTSDRRREATSDAERRVADARRHLADAAAELRDAERALREETNP